jgi:peptidoglycan hydrolase-like protein with peptidoglycan-binding domain
MKLQSRNLVFGMQGKYVRELQRDLVWLGFDILSQEITSGRFGETTRAAVQMLQKENRLELDGVVETKTVEVINKKLGVLKRVVRGNLRQADGKPLERAKVRVFDKDLRTETKLAEATSDAAGYFEINYVFSVPDKVAPNLVVKGFASARQVKPVAVSAVVFEASPALIINLVAGESEFRGLSEFELLMRDIKPIVEGQRIKIADLVEDETTQDISFLSSQTRHSADRVVHTVLSHRHAEKSGLEPEVFYAFLRQGLPTEPTAMLSQDASILRRALIQAVKNNVIPQGFETEDKLKSILEGLSAWRVSVALEDPADAMQMTLGKLVKSVLPEETLQQQFMRAYAGHVGAVDDFWKSLGQDAQLAPRAAELKFAVLLGNLGQNHLPLVDAVRSTPELKELKDLVTLSEDGWHALIIERRVGTPLGIEGADDADKAHQYARLLANAVEAAVPTEFFVARLKESEVEGKRDLLTFFQANPAFNIKDTRLDPFLRANPEALNSVGDKTSAVKQLKGLQRVYQLAPSFKPAMALQQAGKDSAHSISRMGQKAFGTSYGRHFDNAEQAKEAYVKARQVSAMAVALLADVNPSTSLTMRAVPDMVARESAVWATLFGSLDVCSCEHCQSVHGPAAYLVDVLNFLKDRAAESSALVPSDTVPSDPVPSVKDRLFARRPDLGEIELTCENTNTVMPYVDLVLEILEDAVAPPPGFSPFELDSDLIADLDQGRVSADLSAAFAVDLEPDARIRVKRPGEWWVVDDQNFSYNVRKQASGKPKVETRSRQTSGTQQERAANPQYIYSKAYDQLKEAVFPWTLPFDQSLEESRAYLGHLGVARHQVMEAFLPGERRPVLGNPALAAEYLGLSRKEAALISGTDSTPPWEQWGFDVEIQSDDATWLAKIEIIDEFLRRSGLAYRELLDLLQTQYVNSGNSLTIDSTDVDHPDTCDTGKLKLHDELSADVASRILRFVRLWRKLGWTLFDLDRAITALGGDLTTEFLVQVSHLSRLRKRFNLPVNRLLAFWAPLDTMRYTNHDEIGKPVVPSLYDELFRSPVSIGPLDTVFTEDPAALTGNLSGHADAVAAVLQVSAADLDALVRSDKVFPQGANIALNLPSLSTLYRHAALAKALKLRVQDYLVALEHIDIAPFNSAKHTVLFVESVAGVIGSQFSFTDVDYLLRHQSEAQSAIALDERVIFDRLQDVRQELQKGATKETIARKLAETLGFEMHTVKLLEPQWASLMDPQLADEQITITEESFREQFEVLRRVHKISVIASRFNMRAEMLDWLLTHGDAQGLLDLRTLPAEPATPDFPKWLRLFALLTLREAFHRGEQGLLELLELAHRNVVPTQSEVLDKLVEQTAWNRTDLEFLVGANGFALTLPEDCKNEQALLRLRDCFDVLKRLGMSAEQAKNLSTADVSSGMARTVRQAVRAKYDDTQWLSIAKPLRDVLRERQRAALVAYLVAHLKLPFTQRETPHPDLSLNFDRPAVRELQQKLNAAGADPALAVDGVFGPETRDAVIAFQNANGLPANGLVRATTWAELDLVRRNLRDANELYGHFLIDVEMDPCMMTSRIKQAISSVQLFVQRCLMNLENGVLAGAEIDDAWDWWKWMKNYRVWEANRKVFLYPENWIEPELRDDKSPFFKELESELLESDLTLESAEKAFLNYVEKLDHVARLEVMGVYHQKDSQLDILHVFARTQAPPRVYYYRQRVNSAFWTPWEKIDLDIEGNHLIPVVWNSRLLLFWPMFMEKAETLILKIPPSASGGDVTGEPKKYWDMKLAWSERKQGKWTSKKISSQSAKISQSDGQLADVSKVFFTVSVGKDLMIDQAYVTNAVRSEVASSTMARPANPITYGTGSNHIDIDDVADPVLDEGNSPATDSYIVGSQNLFYFGGCSFDPLVYPHGNSAIGSGQNVPIGTERFHMSFQEKEDAALNLPVRRDINNSNAALTQTPGQYRVISQEADPRVTRNPFFFQDPSRSYLVTPKLSWFDDTFIDPSEVGGVIAVKRRVTAVTSPAVTHGVAEAEVVSTTDMSSRSVMELLGATRLAVPPAIALGPDTHVFGPFNQRPNTKYSFHTFYHPYVCALISILNRRGLGQMLRREVQLDPHKFMPGDTSIMPFNFQAVYAPANDLVAQPYPTEEMDFSFSGPYSSYNWELFFHTPLLIADRLGKNQRFEEAAKWFHYIFNPTDISSKPAPQRYWQTKEFFEKTSEDYQQERLDSLFNLLAGALELRQKPDLTPDEQKDLRRVNDLEASIKAWRDQPFKPHLVARTRTTAYQKTVVMKYIDNLIAWGDQLFRRDTLETLNEATQLYVLAADILGARPVELPSRLAPSTQTYNALEGRLDRFSNALVEIEELVPVDADLSASDPEQQPPTMLYFCLPKNDKLLRYWDTVADRLFKIRHCMNIEGVVRQLPLFEPPIDPALLVRGVAAGLDLNSLLNDVNTILPGYRFNVLAQKATELCSELRSLGANLLSTLEKRDAEELSLLRAKHETGLFEMIEQVREKQVEEAAQQLTALLASRDVIIGRLGHYQRLLGESNPKSPAVGERVQERDRPRFSEIQSLAGVKMFPHEVLENTLLGVAQGLETHAATQEFLAAVLHVFPDVNLMFMGMGGTVSGLGDIPKAVAAGDRGLASVVHFGANMTSRLGSYIARELDWVLQHNQAAREIMQIDKQIIAAEIRIEIARHELRNHRRQMENALEVEEFMRDKYSNRELYSWMVGQMSGVYFQAYQLTYETAKRAEKCCRFELGIEDSSFIQFGYWDSLKKGLMAGEKLHHDLKRMETAYLEQNRREFELTKSISLLLLDPLALVKLRETGRCFISLPEEIFDLDYPGHYFRRIKSVSIALPCVVGPYTTISCTLRLQKSSIRINPTDGVNGYPRNPSADPRFLDLENNIPVKAIAASNAQNDSGVFELSFRDERYLPFEGAGVISEWSLELFNDSSPDFGKSLRQFDYSTISDAILHVKYTAREDAGTFKNGAVAHLRDYFSKLGTTPSLRLFNLRQEFPTQWYRFVKPANPEDGNVFEFEMTSDLFPIRDAGKTLKVNTLWLLARCTNSGSYTTVLTIPSRSVAMTTSPLPEYGSLQYSQMDVSVSEVQVTSTDQPVKWSLKVTPPDNGNLQKDEVGDVLLILGYEWE